MRAVVRAVVAELPAAFHSATAVVGGIALALAALGLLRATEPWGAWLLALASGGH